MKNKKVKQMMLDIERQDGELVGNNLLTWFGGVCLVSNCRNFLWLNQRTVSLKANYIGGKK